MRFDDRETLPVVGWLPTECGGEIHSGYQVIDPLTVGPLLCE
jgi:hypothetical protein